MSRDDRCCISFLSDIFNVTAGAKIIKRCDLSDGGIVYCEFASKQVF
jgi:hypothetical protein